MNVFEWFVALVQFLTLEHEIKHWLHLFLLFLMWMHPYQYYKPRLPLIYQYNINKNLLIIKNNS
jgi:hypothetical protein